MMSMVLQDNHVVTLFIAIATKNRLLNK